MSESFKILRPTAAEMTIGAERENAEPGMHGSPADSQAAQDARARQLREAADKGVDGLKTKALADAENPAPSVEPSEEVIREDVESVVLLMPNGKQVEYGPRRTATTLRVATILGDSKPNQMTAGIVSTLMWIRKIDGEPVELPASMVDIQKLMNEIGDEGTDILSTARMKFWPGVDRDTLPVLKKNLRGS